MSGDSKLAKGCKFTRTSMDCVSFSLVFFLITFQAFTQNPWNDEEITDVFDGLDVSEALARVEAKGVTAFDFGFDLLASGKGQKAKEWFRAIGIATKDPQYIYGLAWVKWKTGDNPGALKDGHFLIQKDIPPLIRARTFYLLGCVQIDEGQFGEAQKSLEEGFEAYSALDKNGGQYLCLSMQAWAAVFEGQYDKVEPLLEKAMEYNQKIRAKGKEPFSLGKKHEIIGEMHFAQGEYIDALSATEESERVYREAGETLAADEILAKVALLKFMTGEPKEAGRLATDLWEQFNNSPDRDRLLAYNNIVLMKLSQCAQQEADWKKKENAARSWASGSPGGKALLNLLEFVKKIPCPEWR